MVTTHGGGRWWAWAASRIAPAAGNRGSGAPVAADRVSGAPETRQGGVGAAAPPVTVHNQQSGPANHVVQVGQLFGGVHIHEGAAPVPDDSAWLRSCWEVAGDAPFEVRYVNRPERPGLDCFLITRADSVDQDDARRRVADSRARLGRVPGHVGAEPVVDEAHARWVLEPFRPHGAGLVEVRKRLTARRSSRDDARDPWLTAVTPLARSPRSWEPLWAELARLPFEAVLSVGLLGYRVGPGLRSHLAARAAEFGRLAREGPSRTGVWHAPRPPDEFAVAALPLVSEAVRRYTDRAYLARVTLAATRPIPPLLAELVADTLSSRDPGVGFAGPAVLRPGAADAAIAWHNATSLGFAPLSAYDQGNPPEAIGAVERVLGGIVDLDEAAAVCRLPYRVSSGSPLFVDHSS
ncbi:hypothetical protein V5P93_005148 [Actinokineospora auranticolor]|uniref:hypothetical protein n=1 Tax=Actinokineospora auranticolor TaxID=155976 RepID=UPI000CEC5699|nr:hypothetical protein [Actinokineospora auranticolor]